MTGKEISVATQLPVAEAGKYRTIVADPPWRVHRPPGWNGTKNPPMPYETMTLAEIAALPVESLAAPVAHLYLWTINRYVEQSYAIARGWGFTPSTLLVWGKTPRGLGAGGHYALTTEYILFARRGTEGSNPPVRSPVVSASGGTPGETKPSTTSRWKVPREPTGRG